MAQHLELGLDTFGDVTAGPDGKLLSHAQVIRNVVEEAVLADKLGVDFIGVGEHHRGDFAISAPEVVLAGIASRTNRIRLGSAVTVLSSDDPVRVFQRSRRWTPFRADAPRSFLDADRLPSLSRSSVTISASTRSCSPRSSTCSRP